MRSVDQGAVVGATFGDLVYRSRRQAGKTQAQVAEAAGCSAAHISYIERGFAAPERDLAHAIGRALGLPEEVVSELFYDSQTRVERAIAQDFRLNAQAKKMLLAAYQSAAAPTCPDSSPGRSGPDAAEGKRGARSNCYPAVESRSGNGV